MKGFPGTTLFRADLVLMYFVTLDASSGELVRLTMTPLQIHRFRLQSPSDEDRALVGKILARECEQFGHRVALHEHRLILDWH